MIIIHHNDADGRLFTVSMYSEKKTVDCADICKQHGGGGHKGAAGFTCPALPFTKTS
jgi:nanoRNase/pAp phosphatase (c-di-AMP/oligoRNAs hydrolase)